MKFILLILLSYLLGSIPTSFLIGKWWKGIDLRQFGSGNVGATNAFRVLGKTAGILSLVGDVAKGLISVTLLPIFLNFSTFVSNSPTFLKDLIFVCAGLAAVCGHNWTIFLKFKGGKGVATSLGVVLGLMPKPALVAILIWCLIVFLSKYVSLGSITSAITFPFLVYAYENSMVYFALSIILCLLIVLRHRSNISRLLKGTENKIQWKRSSAISLLVFILLFSPQGITSVFSEEILQIFKIRHVDVDKLKNLITQLLQESMTRYPKAQPLPYTTSRITPGAGNGINFYGCIVELINVFGTNESDATARLYIFSSQRDTEVELKKGASTRFENFRIRVTQIDLKKNEAEIEIRALAGVGYAPWQRNISIKADKNTNSIIVIADNQSDLDRVAEWINMLDRPPLTYQEVKLAEIRKLAKQAKEKAISSAQAKATLEYLEAHQKNKEAYERKEITFTEFEAEERRLEQLKYQRLIESIRLGEKVYQDTLKELLKKEGLISESGK